jgi:hypothetical protein
VNIFEAWLSHKLERRRCTLREGRTIRQEYNRIVGPRSIIAHLELTAAPADDFQFRSNAAWPTDDERAEYEPAVLEGILDELLTSEAQFGFLVTRVSFTLQTIKSHPVYSSSLAFYHVTREAMRNVMDGNVLWSWEEEKQPKP